MAIDNAMQHSILAVARCGMTSAQASGFFRVALGLHYLVGLMTKETLDFKQIDREYNRFIYHSIGSGHSITSVLQFMSGEKVLPVLESKCFIDAFAAHCPAVPVDTIAFLLSLNLGVAKSISGIDPVGPVAHWIARQQEIEQEREQERQQTGGPEIESEIAPQPESKPHGQSTGTQP
jgi:hypothetical protein